MKIFTDGAARGNPGPAAAGFVVIDKQAEILCQRGRFLGRTTNNVAEYQAVVMAWEYLVNSQQQTVNSKQSTVNSWRKINFYLDSLLVVNQLNGRFKIKNRKLQELAEEVKRLEKEAGVGVNYAYIPRQKNFLADKLVNQILDNL
jgi:ribonuclease HI